MRTTAAFARRPVEGFAVGFLVGVLIVSPFVADALARPDAGTTGGEVAPRLIYAAAVGVVLGLFGWWRAGSSVPVAARVHRNTVVRATLALALITVADGGYAVARAASVPGPAIWTMASLVFAVGAVMTVIGVRRVRAANRVLRPANEQRRDSNDAGTRR